MLQSTEIRRHGPILDIGLTFHPMSYRAPMDDGDGHSASVMVRLMQSIASIAYSDVFFSSPASIIVSLSRP